MARDTIVLYHLPKAPHFDQLYKGAQNITASQKGYQYVYRVNCGGPDYIDENKNTWQADRSLPSENERQTLNIKPQTNFWGSVSWADRFPGMPAVFASQRRSFSPVKGTRDWSLFQQFRYGKADLNYTFPLPDGNYIVELYFTEPWLGIGGGIDATGMRLFDVAFNNEVVLKDLDIWKEVGTNTALKKIVPVTVTGGRLVISFPHSKAGQALISAIAIATRANNMRSAATFENITNLKGDGIMQRTWLDIGDAPFANEKIQIHQLPPELFAADWIQTNRKQTKELSFKVRLPSDIYKAVFPELSARASADGFNNTGEWIITDEEGGKNMQYIRNGWLPANKFQ